MAGSLPVFALIRIYWALITELRGRPANSKHCYILWRKLWKTSSPSPSLHIRPWPQTHTWPSGGGGQVESGQPGVNLFWLGWLSIVTLSPVLISDCDSWSCDITLWSIPCCTHIWSLLICSGDFWPRLIAVTHVWSPLSTEPRRPAGLATHYVVKLFIVPPVFQTPQEFGGKKSMASF